MRLLMIVHGRVERPRDAGVERPSETSARHSIALCVLLVLLYTVIYKQIETYEGMHNSRNHTTFYHAQFT